jgi:nitrate reductase assembly molybdenum cofactor insertion protein NarJ
MRALSHYESFAALFDYPGADYRARVWAAHGAVVEHCPEAAARLETFAAALPEATTEIQEIFTRSFDIQAITTLSVGYLLFGDDYKRGELLANLNREHRDAGVDCGRELSDHLPNVLRLMARWADHELVTELVQEIVRPAVERMIAEFGPARMEERNRLYAKHFKTLIAASAERGTMFREPLAALAAVLDRDFQRAEREPPARNLDFLESLGRELDIEASEGRPTAPGIKP